mmetsp:Transcript_340/g.467  ORF Transcript_340/g.467 Transcript_340/m.467 type:complete len:114 (+) Transcript_340:3-344(+)
MLVWLMALTKESWSGWMMEWLWEQMLVQFCTSLTPWNLFWIYLRGSVPGDERLEYDDVNGQSEDLGQEKYSDSVLRCAYRYQVTLVRISALGSMHSHIRRDFLHVNHSVLPSQ